MYEPVSVVEDLEFASKSNRLCSQLHCCRVLVPGYWLPLVCVSHLSYRRPYCVRTQRRETVASTQTVVWAACFMRGLVENFQQWPFVLCLQATGYMCCSLASVLLT